MSEKSAISAHSLIRKSCWGCGHILGLRREQKYVRPLRKSVFIFGILSILIKSIDFVRMIIS